MKTIQILLIATLVIILLAACTGGGQAQPKTFTIGIVNITPVLDRTVEGFKAGMAEAGYREGENVIYVYEGATGSIEGLDPAVQNVLATDVDLILTLTTVATIKAKQATEGSDIPLSLPRSPMRSRRAW